MCHFITAVLPKNADADAIGEVMRNHGRRLTPLHNPSIAAQIGAHERYFYTTAGHCDCDTSLGELRPAPAWAGKAKRPDDEAARLRRRGWSETKIARALTQRGEHEARRQAEIERRPKVPDTQWLRCIREVLMSGKTDAFGLLLHQYSGALDARIELQGRETIRLADLDAETLGMMHEDVLYDFRR